MGLRTFRRFFEESKVIWPGTYESWDRNKTDAKLCKRCQVEFKRTKPGQRYCDTCREQKANGQ